MNNTHPHGEHISAYLDGMLDVARTHEIALHLSICPACRATLEAFQTTKALLHNLDAPAAPSPEFWVNTYRRLRVEGEARPATRPAFRQSRQAAFQSTQRRWAAGVTAVVVLGATLVGPLLIHPSVVPPAPPTAYDTVDVSSLVQAHTDAASREPLADPDRQAMLSADADNTFSADDAGSEAAVHADATP